MVYMAAKFIDIMIKLKLFLQANTKGLNPPRKRNDAWLLDMSQTNWSDETGN